MKPPRVYHKVDLLDLLNAETTITLKKKRLDNSSNEDSYSVEGERHKQSLDDSEYESQESKHNKKTKQTNKRQAKEESKVFKKGKKQYKEITKE